MPFEFRDVGKRPLTAAESSNLAALAGIPLQALINTGSQTFRKLKPDLAALDELAVAQLLTDQPKIMKRPILTDGRQAVVGFQADEYRRLIGAAETS